MIYEICSSSYVLYSFILRLSQRKSIELTNQVLSTLWNTYNRFSWFLFFLKISQHFRVFLFVCLFFLVRIFLVVFLIFFQISNSSCCKILDTHTYFLTSCLNANRLAMWIKINKNKILKGYDIKESFVQMGWGITRTRIPLNAVDLWEKICSSWEQSHWSTIFMLFKEKKR